MQYMYCALKTMFGENIKNEKNFSHKVESRKINLR